MRYFQNPNDSNKVYAYDTTDSTQASLITAATTAGWVEVTGSWPPAPTTTQIQAGYAAALSSAIDTVAQAWQYDNIYTAATYLTSSVAQFQNEAKALVAWRDTAWNNAQTLLAQVTAGTATMPATSAAFLTAVLPTAPTRPTA
jgi:NCAIR mutase (PurE)-related protein